NRKVAVVKKIDVSAASFRIRVNLGHTPSITSWRTVRGKPRNKKTTCQTAGDDIYGFAITRQPPKLFATLGQNKVGGAVFCRFEAHSFGVEWLLTLSDSNDCRQAVRAPFNAGDGKGPVRS